MRVASRRYCVVIECFDSFVVVRFSRDVFGGFEIRAQCDSFSTHPMKFPTHY